jgi:hypothetical protein
MTYDARPLPEPANYSHSIDSVGRIGAWQGFLAVCG